MKNCASGPMAAANNTVPTPTVPPSSQPAASTTSSMPVRVRRSDRPVRADRPVIRPSRGPGPRPAPTYRPVATPFRAMPPSSRATRGASACTGGRRPSVASAARPTTTTLLAVPMPGRCRSGIQASRTAAPTMMTTRPSGSPVCRASPWCSTSQEARPSPEATISAVLAPNRTSPANSWASRRGQEAGDMSTILCRSSVTCQQLR